MAQEKGILQDPRRQLHHTIIINTLERHRTLLEMSENKKTSSSSNKPPAKPFSGQANIEYRKMKPKELEEFRKFKEKDNLKKENLSRGVIGYVSNPSQSPQGARITEGTLHDKVNQRSRLSAQGQAQRNQQQPLSEQELKKRTEQERDSAQVKKKIQDEMTRKMRIRQQHFPYTPPKDMEDVPGLEAESDEDLVQSQPHAKSPDEVNEQEGEEEIEDNTTAEAEETQEETLSDDDDNEDLDNEGEEEGERTGQSPDPRP